MKAKNKRFAVLVLLMLVSLASGVFNQAAWADGEAALTDSQVVISQVLSNEALGGAEPVDDTTTGGDTAPDDDMASEGDTIPVADTTLTGDATSDGDTTPVPVTEHGSGAPQLLSETPESTTGGDGESSQPKEPEQDPGVEESEETYAVPAGSATLSLTVDQVSLDGLDTVKFTNDTLNNAINNALKAAAEQLRIYDPGPKENDGGIEIKITLNEGNYEGGVNLATVGAAGATATLNESLREAITNLNSKMDKDWTVMDKSLLPPYARIAIVAEGAEDAHGVISSGADDSTVVEGDLIFDGFDVLLAGIYLSLNNKITVTNAGSFEYYGTTHDDNVTINVSDATELTIDTGGGDDRVDLTVKQQPSTIVAIPEVEAFAAAVQIAEIPEESTGDVLLTGDVSKVSQLPDDVGDAVMSAVEIIRESAETAISEVSGIESARINTKLNIRSGEGDDDIRLRLVNSTGFFMNNSLLLNLISPAAAQQYPLFGLWLDMGGTELNADLGDGADTFDVTGGTDSMFGSAAMKAIQTYTDILAATELVGEDEAKRQRLMSSLTINGGGGDDRISVDTTAAYHSMFGIEVDVNGGEGYDRTHLSGTLDEDVSESGRITGDKSEIAIASQASVSVGLFNKNDMDKYGVADFAMSYDVLRLHRSFHVAMTDVDAVTDLLNNKKTVTVDSAGELAGVSSFTDYIVSESLLDAKTIIFTPYGTESFMSNLILRRIDGSIEHDIGESISVPGLNLFIIAPNIVINRAIEAENIILIAESFNSAALDASRSIAEDELSGDGVEIGFDLVEANETAHITIGSDGDIAARGLIDISAATLQTGGFIDASIVQKVDIPQFVIAKKGSAKIDIKARLRAVNGYVSAVTDAYIQFDTEDILALIPVSLAWAHLESMVMVSDGKIEAGAGVVLRSDSQMYVISYDKGSFPLFSMSIASNVGLSDTKTVVKGESEIIARDDIRVDARSRVVSYAMSVSAPTDMANQKAKGGVFVGLSVVMAETLAHIEDDANLKAGGSVAVEADGVLYTKTYAISSPVSSDAVDKDGKPLANTQTVSILSAVSIFEQILGFMPKETGGFAAKLVGGVTGSNSLAQKFSTGTNEVDAPTTPGLQLLGAFAVTYLNNRISALIDTSRDVEAGKALSVRAWGESSSRQRADGSLIKNDSIAVIPGLQQNIHIEKDPTNAAAGAGVAVGVFKHEATAKINEGTVKASQGLTVTANSRRVEASAVSKSGHIPASAAFGLGGAVTVHIVTVKSEARLANTAIYYIEGPITVDASVIGKVETVGDASGKRPRASLNLGVIDIPLMPPSSYQEGGIGVGAGIAVAVTGIDVSAVIEDEIDFHNDNDHGVLSVTASFFGTEDVDAAAGAAGGVSVTPVSATLISGVMTEAYLGTGPEASVDGDFTVRATSSMVRTLGADAAAAGSSVGMGAAVGVSVINDSATAEVKRKLNTTGDVRVEASSISRMTETIKASTTGAITEDGSAVTTEPADTTSTDADKKKVADGKATAQGTADDPNVNDKADKTANEKIGNGKKLSGDVNTKNTNPESVKKSSAKRKSFQTSEGSVQAAAAIAVNVHDNLSMAKVYDGLDVTAVGDVIIRSRIDTDSVIKANAGNTDSLFGVGVGAAVNVVTSENIAYMGKGTVKANSLTVAAEIYEIEQYKSLETVFNELLNLLANAGYMDVVIANARDDSYKDSTAYKCDRLLDKDSLSDEEKSELGEYVSELIDSALWVDGEEVTLRDRINDKIIDSNGAWSIDHAYAMEKYVREYLKAHYAETALPANDAYYALYQSLITELISKVDEKTDAELENYKMIELALNCAEGETLTDDEIRKLAAFLNVQESEVTEGNTKALKQFVIDRLIGRMSGDDAASAAASTVSDSFEAVVDSFMEYMRDPNTWINILKIDLSSGIPRLKLNIPGVAEHAIELKDIGEKTYSALVAMLTSSFGSGDELDGVGHLISTQAVSGVGASGVGVAGAVALSFIDIKSSATVQGVSAALPQGSYDLEITGTVRIEADEAYKSYTTASGSSDKSLGQAAKMDTVGTAGSAVGVGASFAMQTLDSDVAAVLGENRTLKSQSLYIAARLRNDIDTVSVAGSDPIARRDKAQLYTPTLGDRYQNLDADRGTNTKGIAADASVALALINNRVLAVISQGGRVETSGNDIIDTQIVDRVNPDNPKDIVYKKANVYVQAIQQGDGYTEAKAFAAGARVSVGACVALSLAQSDVAALIEAPVNSNGSVRVFALTANTDEMMALATSVGGDINRILEKFREGLNYISPGASETSNLSGTITNELNKAAGPASEKARKGTGKALGYVPLSSNILAVFNIDLSSEDDKAKDASKKANGKATGAGALGVSPEETIPSPSVSIAAAVAAANTQHIARAIISAPITAKSDVDAIAENRANFRVRSSGASVSATILSANSVSAAVAITVNRNKAEAQITGNVNTTNGDVNISALSTQNMDGAYPGYLAAQAVAGSVAAGGVLGLYNIAGAVAVVSDFADTVARLAADVAAKNIYVSAYDKSKLALRSSAVSAGNQLTGAGATFALLYAQSDISARVEDNVTAVADSLTVTAERAMVDQSDYVFPFTWADLFTVTTPDAPPVADKDKGLVHLTLPRDIADISQFKLDNTIGVDKLVDILDLLNYFASVNYYVEAVSASVLGGASPTAAAVGGMTALLAANNVQALIGDKVTLILNNTNGDSLIVDASSEASSRLVAGSVAASASTAGFAGGAILATAYLQDWVESGIGKNGSVNASGDVDISSSTANNLWNITVAAALSSGGTLGGVFNTVYTSANALASVGDGTSVATVGDFALTAANDAGITYISFSASASGGGEASGGRFGAILNENSTQALLGDMVSIEAADIIVRADSSDDMLAVISGNAVAGPGATAAGTIGILINSSLTRSQAGAHAVLRSAGEIQLLAHNTSDMFFTMMTVSASSVGAALGATVNTHIFEQQITARVGDHSILETELGNVLLEATACNNSVDLAFAGGLSGGGLGLSGAAVTILSSTTVTAEYGNSVYVKANDSVGAVAQISGDIISATGNVASGSTTGVGATTHTVVVKNTVSATAGDYVNLIGLAAGSMPNIGEISRAGIKIPSREERRRGVVFSATDHMSVIMASVSGAAAGNAAVTGVASTGVVKSITKAEIGKGALINTDADRAGPREDGAGELQAASGFGGEQELIVEANDDSSLSNFAGALSAGGVGFGATVVTQIFSGSARAVIGDGLTAFVSKDANVTASTDDEVMLLAVSFGGGGTAVEVGASALIFENETYAAVGGSITAGRSIIIEAASNTSVFSNALAGGGGLSSAAAPVAVVIYLQGKTDAELYENSSLTSVSAVILRANSAELVKTDAAGASVSSGAAVSGAVSVIVAKLCTRAIAGDGVIIRGMSVEVSADDSFKGDSTVGIIAASGTSVGVIAAVSVIWNTVTASVGADSQLSTTNGDVEVTANAVRNLSSYAVSAAVASTVGVGATIMADVIGARLSKDSTDGLLYNNNNGGLRADELMSMFSSDPDAGETLSRIDLEGDLAPDDEDSVSAYKVGSEKGVDVTTGYEAEELKNADGIGSEGEGYAADGAGNKELEDAANIGQVTRAYAPMDAICALIGANTIIIASGDIAIEASDTLSIDAVTGTLAAGGSVGVGAGVAIVISYSNVKAYVDSGAVFNADSNVRISASSSSSDDNFRREVNGLSEVLGTTVNSHGIRAISLTAVASMTGVAVPAAVVTLDSNVSSEFNGSVSRAVGLSVRSVTEHSNILAATLSISAGMTTVSTPVSVVRSVGEAVAAIGGNGTITVSAGVTVSGVHTFKALSAAAAFGAGVTNVNAALALAINRMTGHTYIGRGVTVDAGSVTLSSVADTSARALLLGANIGATVSVGVGVAIAIDEATIYTYAGETPQGEAKPSASAINAGSITTLGTFTVSNRISSQTIPDILFITAAPISVAVNVLLAFNRVNAIAGINKINVDAGGDISVTAAMEAETSAALYKSNIGGLAVGAAVCYAQMRAFNQALIDLTGVTVKGTASLNINAGSEASPNSAYASAATTSGNISIIGVVLNAAVADNNARNSAIVKGTGSLILDGGVNVESKLRAAADASLTGLSIGAVKVIAGVVVANNRADNRAELYADNISASAVAVGADIQPGIYEALSRAAIIQGEGILDLSGYEAAVNAAIAYARSVNTAKAGAMHMTLNGGGIEIISGGTAKAKTEIKNLSVVDMGLISAGAMVGFAYAQAEFNALLELGGDSLLRASNVTVKTDYVSAAYALVQPSTGGIKVSSVSVEFNMAVAAASSKARAGIIRRGMDGLRPIVDSSGSVEVSSLGGVTAEAKVTTANLSFGAVNIGVNLVYARVAGEQLTELSDVTVKSANNVTVSSDLNRSRPGGVLATVGAAGGESARVSAMSGKVNAATAINSMKSKAISAKSDVSAGNEFKVSAISDIRAKAEVELPTLELSLKNVALNTVFAKSSGELLAQLDISTASVSANSITVETDYINDALAEIAPSGSVSAALNYKSVDANLGEATADTKAASRIEGNGTLSSAVDLSVLTRAAGGAAARQKSVSFSISKYNISMNATKASVKDSLSAGIIGSGVYSIVGTVSVHSIYQGSGAQAQTGGAMGNESAEISLVGANANAACADASITNSAAITGSMTMEAGSVDINAHSGGSAKAEALSCVNSLNGISIGNLTATGTVNGSTIASFGGGSFKIERNVQVNAYDAPSLYIKSQLPGRSISAISANLSTVSGEIGSDSKRSSVTARLLDNTVLNVGGGKLLVQARNLPVKNQLVIDKGDVTALANVSLTSLSSKTTLLTTASLGSNSQILVLGTVTVSAEDVPQAENKAAGSSIGILINANAYYASNTADSIVEASLGDNLKLTARGNVIVLAKTNARLSAITDSDSGSLFNGGMLYSKNIIRRKVNVTAGEGVELKSLGGGISMKTSSGEEDVIVTKTLDTSKGLVNVNYVEAVTEVYIDQLMKLKNGFKAIAYVGDVRLENAVSLDRLVNYAQSNTAAAYAYQRSEAKTKINIKSSLLLGEAPTGGSAVISNELQGYNVWMLNWLKKANVVNEVDVTNNGFTGNMDPFCRIDLNFETMRLEANQGVVQAYSAFNMYNVGYHTTLHQKGDVYLYNRAYLNLPEISADWLQAVLNNWTTNREYNDDVYIRVNYDFDTKVADFYVFTIAKADYTGFLETVPPIADQKNYSKNYDQKIHYTNYDYNQLFMFSEIYFDTTFIFDSFDGYYVEFNSVTMPTKNTTVDYTGGFQTMRMDLHFADPGAGTYDNSNKVSPVVIYLYDDGGTVKWTVANDLLGIAENIVFVDGKISIPDLVQNSKYGRFWSAELMPDFTIINDTGVDVQLHDFEFKTNDTIAGSKVEVISTYPVDVHYLGIATRAVDTNRPVFEFKWLDEYGFIHVGSPQGGEISIRSDSDITNTTGATIEVNGDNYTITGLSLNVARDAVPNISLDNADPRLKLIVYEAAELYINNHTAKNLVIEGVAGSWIDDSDNHWIDYFGALVEINSNGGGVLLNGEVNAESLIISWAEAAGDLILGKNAVIRTRGLTVSNARDVKGTNADGSDGVATVWLMSSDSISVSAARDILLRLNVLRTQRSSTTYIDKLEALGNIRAVFALCEGYAASVNDIVMHTDATDFVLGDVKGVNVTLDVMNNVSLVDGDEDGATDLDVSGNLNIITRYLAGFGQYGHLGTAENPLEIRAGGKLLIRQADDDPWKGNFEPNYSVYLHVPQGGLDMDETNLGSAAKYEGQLDVIISAPEGSLSIGNIGIYVDELSLSAGFDIVTGVLFRGGEDFSRNITAGGSITVKAPEYLFLDETYHSSIIGIGENTAPERIDFVLNAGHDLVFEGELVLPHGMKATAGRDIIIQGSAQFNGATELTAGRNISVSDNLDANYTLDLLADGGIHMVGDLTDKGYTTLRSRDSITVLGLLYAQNVANTLTGREQKISLGTDGNTSIAYLIIDNKDIDFCSEKGSISISGFGFCDSKAVLRAPNGEVRMGLAPERELWHYASLERTELTVEAKGTIDLGFGEGDKPLRLVDKPVLSLNSSSGLVRIGDVSVDNPGAGVLETAGDTQLRSYNQSANDSSDDLMSIRVGGELSMTGFVSNGSTDIRAQGALMADSFKSNDGVSTIDAQSICVSGVVSNNEGRLELTAEGYVDIDTITLGGNGIEVTAGSQRGMVSTVICSTDARLTFIVAHGDIRMMNMQINGLYCPADASQADKEAIRQELREPTVLLRAENGSILVESISMNFDVNMLLDAALDIGSAQTPLKLTAYSDLDCLERQKHSFLWGRDLYLDYNYQVANPNGGGNLSPELKLQPSGGDRGVYLRSGSNPVALDSDGSLAGYIHSNALITINSRNGSIGSAEKPFVADRYSTYYESQSVRLGAVAAGSIHLHTPGSFAPENIHAGGTVCIVVDGILDVPTAPQGESEYTVSSMANDISITVNSEYAHSATNKALLVDGNAVLGTPLKIRLSSPDGGIRSAFNGNIELYLIERGLNDYYDVDINTIGILNIIHEDSDGIDGTLYLNGASSAEKGISISSDGTLVFCCSLNSGSGGISAKAENIKIWGSASFGTDNGETGVLSLCADENIDFIIMTHLYSDEDAHIPQLGLAGDLKLKAYGKVTLAAQLKDGVTPTAHSLSIDARGDIELLGELWFTGGVSLGTPGDIALLAYSDIFVDENGNETEVELPMSLRAGGDINLNAGGAIKTGLSRGINGEEWGSEYALKNNVIRSGSGSVRAGAGGELSMGNVVSDSKDVSLSSGSLMLLGSASAKSKLTLEGLDGISALGSENGEASLSAGEFSFSTRGTLANDQGGYLLIKHTAAEIKPVGIHAADFDTVVKLKAVDSAGRPVDVTVSGSAYLSKEGVLIRSAAELAAMLDTVAVGNLVKLRRDVSLNKALSLVLDRGVSIVLDLDGFKLTLAGGHSDMAGLSMGGDGVLTIENGRLRANSGVQPALFAVSGTLTLADGAIIENAGCAVQLLGAGLNVAVTPGAKAELISASGRLIECSEYGIISMAVSQRLPQQLTLSGHATAAERILYVSPDGTLAEVNLAAASVTNTELSSEIAGYGSACWQGIEQNSYIILLAQSEVPGQVAPELTAFSLDSFRYVTLPTDKYEIKYEKNIGGVWTETSAGQTVDMGSYRLTVLPKGNVRFHAGTTQIAFGIVAAGESGVKIEDTTRFVFSGSTESFSPIPMGVQPGDIIYYQIGQSTPVTQLSFDYEDYTSADSVIEITYTVLRGDLLYNGGSFKFKLIDLTNCDDIYVNDLIAEYGSYTDEQIIEYNDNIELVTPSRVAMRVRDSVAGEYTIEFSEEMQRYYLAPTIYSLWYDVGSNGYFNGISMVKPLRLEQGETAYYSICLNCNCFERDCTCAAEDQRLSAYASHVECGHTDRCKVKGSCQCGECSLSNDKCIELFGSDFQLCGDESCNEPTCNHRHYERYYLGIDNYFNSAANGFSVNDNAAYLMKGSGGKIYNEFFGGMTLNIKSDGALSAEDWPVQEELALITDKYDDVDFFDYISFAEGRGDESFTVKYELRNEQGETVEDLTTLAAGRYTAVLQLRSTRYSILSGEKTVTIQVLDEENFIRFYLYDETRGLEVSANEQEYSGYERFGNSYHINARPVEGAAGSYTDFGFGYENLSGGDYVLESVLFSLDGLVFKPMSELEFGFSASTVEDGFYVGKTLYYRMEGSYEGLPVSSTGEFTLTVHPLKPENDTGGLNPAPYYSPLTLITGPDGDTVEYEQRGISLPTDGNDVPQRLLLLKVLPENDGYELRTLNLSHEIINAQIAEGYTRICFMLGDVAVFIDIGTLTAGDYDFTLEPDGYGRYRLRISCNGEEVKNAAHSVTMAFVTQDAQDGGTSILKLDEDGNIVAELDAELIPAQNDGELPAFYAVHTDEAGLYTLSNSVPRSAAG